MNTEFLPPQKRGEILYARVSLANKRFIQDRAKGEGVSESTFVDFVLTSFRKASAGKQGKSGRGN